MPLLLGLAVVIAGMLLWDRWVRLEQQRREPGPVVAGPDKAPTKAAGLGGDAAAVGEDGSPHPPASLSLDALRDTVRRPLFEKTRRPVEAPGA